MKIKPEAGSASIVLLGALNPRIFTPEWFLINKLIDDVQFENADVQIIHNEVASFSTDWFSIKVETLPQNSRIIFSTKHEPFIRLYDLVINVFGEILTHTPLGILGINREVHFPLTDVSVRNKIGKILAPREPWGEWGDNIQSADDGDLLHMGGLQSLTMEDRNLDDRDIGYIRTLIEPSEVVKYGIFMRVNDHYSISNPEKVIGCNEIISMLAENFDSSINRSEWIINQIMELA